MSYPGPSKGVASALDWLRSLWPVINNSNNGLFNPPPTEDSAPSLSNDFLWFYDVSQGVARKVKPVDLMSGKQPLDATLTALAAYNTTGFLVQTAADTFAGRTLQAGTGVAITNPAGTAGDPTIAVTDGSVINSATGSYASYTAFDGSTAANQIPTDNTIPQSGEGTEIITVAITPRSSTSKLRIRFSGFGTADGQCAMVAALFRDSGADAIYAAESDITDANFREVVSGEVQVDASSTSATTFKLRVGPNNTQIMYANGSTTARLFGGVASWRMVVEEIKSA